MATLTITTTNGTALTYAGLDLEDAQRRAQGIKNARREGMQWWSIEHGTTTDDINPQTVTTIRVDTTDTNG